MSEQIAAVRRFPFAAAPKIGGESIRVARAEKQPVTINREYAEASGNLTVTNDSLTLGKFGKLVKEMDDRTPNGVAKRDLVENRDTDVLSGPEFVGQAKNRVAVI